MTERAARRARRLLALVPEDTGFALPGAARDLAPDIRARFDAAASAFARGYRLAVEDDDIRSLKARIEALDPRVMGFAYEGAGMALVCEERFFPRESPAIARLLELCDEQRGALVCVGAGWAQARLDRPADERPAGVADEWRPFLEDGYGFFQGLFQAYRFLARRPFPFISHHADRGLGRSLWFVCAADSGRMSERLEKFAEERRPSLWTGIGVACAFTGGVAHASILEVRAAAGPYAEDMRRGVESVHQLHASMGTIPDHVRLAMSALSSSPIGHI